MDGQKNLFLNYTYVYQDNNMDELRQAQKMMLTMPVEDARIKGKEDSKVRDQQITQFQELLTSVSYVQWVWFQDLPKT